MYSCLFSRVHGLAEVLLMRPAGSFEMQELNTAAGADSTVKGRLLVVDDEENILRSIRRVLRRTGWEIETAPDGARGLETLHAFRPEVVISDFRMPGMNGVEFLSAVKQESPRTQRIMLTGQADQHAIEEAINRSEIFRFVSKPWNDAQLVLTVKSAFEQFALHAENERLMALTRAQNEELKVLNHGLEARVQMRTQQLSVAKREWELTFDSIEDPLAVVTMKDLRVRRANTAYAKAAKRPITEIANAPHCHEFLFGRSTACEKCPVSKSVHGGKTELQHDGKVFELKTFPLDEERAVCVYTDVTEERVLVQRMIEAEKMAAVGQLAGGVAHEINNPLGGILAFSQLMQRDAGRSSNDLESLKLIEESAVRCKRIVESLLRFSRRSTGEDRVLLDLNRCVEETTPLFNAQLKGAPKATLKLELARELPPVFASSLQLGQVLLNLLHNGLQALPKGAGTLKIETGQDGARAFFRVSDTGTGIAPENLPHIFEPSFTTKPPGEGTGLGLSIAYRITQDHGGNIEVDTSVGKGSTFTVYLPIAPSGAASEKGNP